MHCQIQVLNYSREFVCLRYRAYQECLDSMKSSYIGGGMVQIFVAIPLQTLINCEMILMWLYVDMICISTDATILSCIGCPLDHTCARASDTFLQEHSVDGVFQQLQQSSLASGAPWTTYYARASDTFMQEHSVDGKNHDFFFFFLIKKFISSI